MCYWLISGYNSLKNPLIAWLMGIFFYYLCVVILSILNYFGDDAMLRAYCVWGLVDASKRGYECLEPILQEHVLVFRRRLCDFSYVK